MIGDSLAVLLITSTQSDLAVDEWILTFPATKELDKNLIWFRPMMNRIAMRLLARALFGAKFRLFFGAALSILDLLTDIQTIVRFINEGKNGFAKASIAFIGVSLLLQILIAFAQNKKRGKKIIGHEMLIAVAMIKPAMDAKKVADGNIQLEDTLFVPNIELTISKCAEIFAEAIPSSVLQVFALFEAKKAGSAAIFSILISAFTIAYSSTIISMDFDTEPLARNTNPDFFGYIPDNNRGLVMFLMVVMTTSHVLIKVVACALMMRMSQACFWLYVLCDTSLYFVYKIIRGDLRYWIPLDGILGWLITVIARVGIKIITDFTLIVQFRHHNELGKSSSKSSRDSRA